MPRRLRQCLLLVAGLVAGSIFVEIYLRVVEATPLWRLLPVAEASLYGPHEETGYAHRAGAGGVWITENRARVAINDLGLRDRAGRTLTKLPGTRRYAIVGDSTVEALQVPIESTFVFLAEQALQRGSTAKVEVANLGLAGATPAVIVERVRGGLVRLGLDGVVVLVQASDLARSAPDDDSEFVGYVRNADGSARLSYGFRDGRGYRLRTGEIGRGIYAAIDHSRLALVLNNRRNAGLLADLPGTPPRRAATPVGCDDKAAQEAVGMWSGAAHGFGSARLTAFLADLRSASQQAGAPMVLALRGLRKCGRVVVDDKVAHAAQRRVESEGIILLDVDRTLKQLVADRDLSSLHGFGAQIGSGHLNEDGHRVYAAIMSEAVEQLVVARDRR